MLVRVAWSPRTGTRASPEDGDQSKQEGLSHSHRTTSASDFRGPGAGLSAA